MGVSHNFWGDILLGKFDLPGHMVITDTCNKNHGTGGKTLRYAQSNICVWCSKTHSGQMMQKKETAALAGQTKMVAIDHLREDLEIRKLEQGLIPI